MYDAKLRCAELARAVLGDVALAERLEREAGELRERFDRAYWVERDGGFYALALDGRKRQVDSRCSNMGHLLWSGIVPDARVADVARSLLEPPLWSGWGVRTMSAEDEAYRPLAYHNGTVWPHDNSLIAHGLALRGEFDAALRILRSMLEASRFFDGGLPEVFAGLARRDTPFPVAYPTASRPQAWAAGAPVLLLRVLLGLEPDPRTRTLAVRSNRLPEWAGDLTLAGLPAFGRRFDVSVRAGRVELTEAEPRFSGPAAGFNSDGPTLRAWARVTDNSGGAPASGARGGAFVGAAVECRTGHARDPRRVRHMEHVLESGMPPVGKLVTARERSRGYGVRSSGSQHLRIAVLAPPWFPVPPARYGGTEAVVNLLVEGLVAEGHDVTLFATGDSTSSANLVSYFGTSRPDSLGTTQADMLQALSCIAEADRFDVVSDHTGALGLSLSNLTSTPFLNTVHGALAGEAGALYRQVCALTPDAALVSLTESHRSTRERPAVVRHDPERDRARRSPVPREARRASTSSGSVGCRWTRGR